MGNPVEMMMAASAAGGIIGGINAHAGEQAQITQLQMEQKQGQLQATNKMLASTTQEQQVMGAQMAQAAASNVSIASPSVKSDTLNSYDNYLLDQKTQSTSLSFFNQSISDQISNVHREFMGNMLGMVAGSAFDMANLYNMNSSTAKAPNDPDINNPTQNYSG